METERPPQTRAPYDPLMAKKSLYDRLGLYQFKALFYKNLTLQFRQAGANFCHVVSADKILTPILLLCILKIMLMGVAQVSEIDKTAFTKKTLFPMVHNFPLGIVRNSSLNPFLMSTCKKWFMYNVQEGAEGGLCDDVVSAISNDPLKEFCPDANRTVPYFERYSEGTFNNYLSSKIAYFNRKAFKPGMEVEGSLY